MRRPHRAQNGGAAPHGGRDGRNDASRSPRAPGPRLKKNARARQQVGGEERPRKKGTRDYWGEAGTVSRIESGSGEKPRADWTSRGLRWYGAIPPSSAALSVGPLGGRSCGQRGKSDVSWRMVLVAARGRRRRGREELLDTRHFTTGAELCLQCAVDERGGQPTTGRRRVPT